MSTKKGGGKVNFFTKSKKYLEFNWQQNCKESVCSCISTFVSSLFVE